MTTVKTNWERSSIYFEFVNKSPAEVQELVASGKLTLEELNNNIAIWTKTIAATVQAIN
jgi:hypothetical protein